MKVLIWIGCMVLNYIMQVISTALVRCIPVSGSDENVVLVGLLSGILAGASIGFCIWLALKLCKILDWYRAMKKAAEAGMSVSEYGRHGLSEEFLSKLETYCKKATIENVKSTLKKCIKKGKITREQYTILLEEYTASKQSRGRR